MEVMSAESGLDLAGASTLGRPAPGLSARAGREGLESLTAMVESGLTSKLLEG